MADNTIYYSAQPLLPLSNRTAFNPSTPSAAKLDTQNSFAQVLNKEITDVKFSQHALERLKSRNLQLNQQDLLELNEAVDKIAAKGAKESLVYMKDVALVVSVKNKTVITAMDSASAKNNIFTNIDSAVIL